MIQHTRTEMTEDDWARLDAILRGVAEHLDYWHHAPLLVRARHAIVAMRERDRVPDADGAA